MSNVRFIGLDVHAETISVAVAEPDGEVRSLGVIPNRPESIRKLVKKLGPAEGLRVCYEAGPTGYVLYAHSARRGGAGRAGGPSCVSQRRRHAGRHATLPNPAIGARIGNSRPTG